MIIAVIRMIKKKIIFVLPALFVLVTGIARIEAATIYVPDQFKTIHEAVENTLPGDTVIVKEGNYNENILITKPITLKSNKGPDTTIVKASNAAEPVFKIFNITGASIIGFTVAGSEVAGIYLHNSDNGIVQYNKATENRLGIALYSSDNNTLKENIASHNKQSGIYLELSNNNIIENNTADSNEEKGLFLSSSNLNRVMFNSMSLNKWNGITLWSSNNNTIHENKVLRNTYGIVLSNSNDNSMEDNKTWTNFYIILPIILIYIGVLIYWIQRKVFTILYREKNV